MLQCGRSAKVLSDEEGQRSVQLLSSWQTVQAWKARYENASGEEGWKLPRRFRSSSSKVQGVRKHVELKQVWFLFIISSHCTYTILITYNLYGRLYSVHFQFSPCSLCHITWPTFSFTFAVQARLEKNNNTATATLGVHEHMLYSVTVYTRHGGDSTGLGSVRLD